MISNSALKIRYLHHALLEERGHPIPGGAEPGDQEALDKLMTLVYDHSLDRRPIIFLFGPPGAGKSSLGKRACADLGLEFLDLSRPEGTADSSTELFDRQTLEAAIVSRSAEVVALSWPIQKDPAARRIVRRSGEVLLLWAHPLDMQARSGCTESLFTPSARIKTRQGFGRSGIGCREFRSLERACENVLMLVDTPFDEAVGSLRRYLEALREESSEPPAVRERLDTWAEIWRMDLGVPGRAAEIVVDAMARYTLHLKSRGASPRRMSAVYSDLDAAGWLVMTYDAPSVQTAAKVLHCFRYPPWELEFKRKFTDSARAIARYRKNLVGFAEFLAGRQAARAGAACPPIPIYRW